MSASTDADVAKEALLAGASAFVNKAAAVDELVLAIQRARQPGNVRFMKRGASMMPLQIARPNPAPGS